jgi:immune inhibitor A
MWSGSNYSSDHRSLGGAQPRRNRLAWLLAGCLVVLVCLACFSVVALTGTIVVGQELIARLEATPTLAAPATVPMTPTPGLVLGDLSAADGLPATMPPSKTPPPTTIATETPHPAALDLNPPPSIEQQPAPPQALEFLANLLAANYPARDYHESARRLGSQDVGERTVNAGPYAVGARQTFTTDDGRVEAELLAISEHAYFWVETSLGFDPNDVAEVALEFETRFYPEVTRLFGTEWRPGVDNDPRFSILHLDGYAEGSELGFFDSGDEYPRSINRASNEQELVYLNMENLLLGEELYYGTLVHEVQHLIHWNLDSNEPAWTNEGLSQLVELLVGLDTVDTVYDFLENPDTQLNSWAYEDEDAIYAHYGAAYLFMVYFWEKLGEQAVVDLARHPGDGLAGVNAILAAYRPDQSLADFVANWTVANYLDDPTAGAEYAYTNLYLEQPSHILEIDTVPFSGINQVNQFGTHYVALELSGDATISFAGDTRRALIDAPPPSGDLMWFAAPVDEVSAHLSADFDLRGLSSATLEFWAWYDLEEDYDFAYVSVSADGGITWQLLLPDHASAGEYGPALNGRSADEPDARDGWVPESISLNSYAGQQITLRFEVLTDAALNGAGFAIDDIAIPELGYASDVETGPDGWLADGFARTGWLLAQQWGLNLIQNGSVPQVTPLVLNEKSQGQWVVELGPEGGVLVITALTPFVSVPASYWLVVQ